MIGILLDDIVAGLSFESVSRRFARLEELEKIWIPREKQESIKSNGAFLHLKLKDKKEQAKTNIPPVTMGYERKK